MSNEALKRAEVLWVRERIKDMLHTRDFTLVLEGESASDGWRAEFIGRIDDEELVLLAHKPTEAPYVTLSVRATLPGFDSSEDCPRLMDTASDFDVSPYLSEEQVDGIHLAFRLLLGSLSSDEFGFAVNNLLFARAAIIGEFGDEEA